MFQFTARKSLLFSITAALFIFSTAVDSYGAKGRPRPSSSTTTTTVLPVCTASSFQYAGNTSTIGGLSSIQLNTSIQVISNGSYVSGATVEVNANSQNPIGSLTTDSIGNANGDIFGFPVGATVGVKVTKTGYNYQSHILNVAYGTNSVQYLGGTVYLTPCRSQ